MATVSYSDGAGQALNTTDLLNQADAQTALNDLNLAVSDVAAQDGYIGAQINTLNSVSQVMSTQQENVYQHRSDPGNGLRIGNGKHVEIRNPEPDGHRRISQPTLCSRSDQALAVRASGQFSVISCQ